MTQILQQGHAPHQVNQGDDAPQQHDQAEAAPTLERLAQVYRWTAREALATEAVASRAEDVHCEAEKIRGEAFTRDRAARLTLVTALLESKGLESADAARWAETWNRHQENPLVTVRVGSATCSIIPEGDSPTTLEEAAELCRVVWIDEPSEPIVTPPTGLSALATSAAKHLESARTLNDATFRLEAEREAAEQTCGSEGDTAKAFRAEMTRLVLERCGVTRPDQMAWNHGTDPVAVLTEGGRTFVVTPSGRDSIVPRGLDELMAKCTLTILDGQHQECGAAQIEPDPPAEASRDFTPTDRRVDARLFEAIGAILDAFAIVRPAYEASIRDSNNNPVTDDDDCPVRDNFGTMAVFGSLDGYLAEAAALAIVATDRSLTRLERRPGPRPKPEDWPSRSVLHRGRVFTGGRFLQEDCSFKVDAVVSLPHQAIDLDGSRPAMVPSPAPEESQPEPELSEDDGLTAFQEIAKPTIFRAAERWDDARIGVANRGRTVGTEDAETTEARRVSVAMAERDARQLEATLSERIREYHGDDPSRPGRMGAEYDALDRLEPCGVWIDDVLYLVTADSTEALNSDSGDQMAIDRVIIVARVSSDRIIDLGESTGPL